MTTTKLPTPDSIRLADDLRAARTVWLKQYGVPVSFEFANFANVVGAAEEYLRLPLIAKAPEMLEALETACLLLRQTYEKFEDYMLDGANGRTFYENLEAVEALIRKAKGE